jgi:hypothetical protein
MLRYYIVETKLTYFLLFSFNFPYQALYYDVRSTLDTRQNTVSPFNLQCVMFLISNADNKSRDPFLNLVNLET